MTSYSLHSDRHVEYRFCTDHMPEGDGREALDVGPGPRAALGIYAMNHGWRVTAVDIDAKREEPGMAWIVGDINKVSFRTNQFDLIINVSSIEHFGLPGRYGIRHFDASADCTAMDRMRDWLSKTGIMIVTLPVGIAAVYSPYHRVYDRDGIADLFLGYTILEYAFWNKQNGVDVYRPCTPDEAFETVPTLEPTRYYAIGGFVLERS